MDAVIKVGGSLSENPTALRDLGQRLGEYAKNYDIVIIPGGGRFADVVRDYDRIFSLSPPVAHKMAILGMDQYGMLLADVMPSSCLITNLRKLKPSHEIGKVQIILPFSIISEEDSFELSWDVTSDSIAAYFAIRMGAAKLILVTDVDGVFTKDPKEKPDVKLFQRISAEKLASLNERTSVDKFLPKLLAKASFSCYVVNGKHPERIGYILAGKRTRCTQVLS